MSYLKKQSKSCRYLQRKRAATQAVALLMSSSEDDDNLTIQTPPLIAVHQCNNSSLPENINRENLLFSDDVETNNIFEDYSQNTDSSSESLSSSIDSVKDIPSLRLVLAQWALRCNVQHSTLNDLLQSVSIFPEFQGLPKTARTLLNTPSMVSIKHIKGGIYHHFSIKNELEDLIRTYDNLPSLLYLMVGIDGLPITNNPVNQLWPILGYFSNIGYERPQVFIIGAYCGKTKPLDSNEFLTYFVNEIKDLSVNGFIYNGKCVKIILKGLICDAPAKSFVLNVKGHSGFYSCTKCDVHGARTDNRVCFPDCSGPLRSDADFAFRTDHNYHLMNKEISALQSIPGIGLVTNVPLDYLHLVCLGVMKKMIMLWMKSRRYNVHIRPVQVQQISNFLENIKCFVPFEFNRKPRSLLMFKQWKATEFRQLLLYTGPVVLMNVVSIDIYSNFLTLHVVITILCSKRLCKQPVFVQYAEDLLKHYVVTFGNLYGHQFISHNIHSLLHITEDVRHFGPLDNLSTLKFENFMQLIKKLVRKYDRPLQQIVKRLGELNNHKSKYSRIRFIGTHRLHVILS